MKNARTRTRTRTRTGTGTGVAVLVALALGGCGKPDKNKVLEALVREVVAPATVEMVARSADLRGAVGKLAEAPSAEALAGARGAWGPAAIAWKRAYAFRAGPIVQTNALLRAAFWPARPAALRTVLDDGQPIDAARLELAGADAVGLYALELLLFGPTGPAPVDDAELLAPAGARRRQYARVIADDVAARAAAVAAHLGDGGKLFGPVFAAPGQESLNRVVNQMVQNIEGIAAGRLNHVIELKQNGLLKPVWIEGWPSGTSLELVKAHLAGTQALYRGGPGGGVQQLVRAAAPGVEDRVGGAFEQTTTKVAVLDAPLERAVDSQKGQLAAAAGAAKNLELALKVDMANALGVTLTFQGGDGD